MLASLAKIYCRWSPPSLPSLFSVTQPNQLERVPIIPKTIVKIDTHFGAFWYFLVLLSDSKRIENRCICWCIFGVGYHSAVIGLKIF